MIGGVSRTTDEKSAANDRGKIPSRSTTILSHFQVSATKYPQMALADRGSVFESQVDAMSV